MSTIERIKNELLTSQILPELHQRNPIRCPLPGHDDGKPSFQYYPKSNSFYCFGCRRGGSVIDLFIHLNGWTLGEAIQYGKEQLGIPVHELTPEEILRQEKLYHREEVLRKVTEINRENLFGTGEISEKARAYEEKGYK